MKKRLSLTVLTALSLSLVGCGSSDSDSSNRSNDVTVERGAVYAATVKDADGNLAQQKSRQNVYTFKNSPVYPVTVSDGWIDVDCDGNMTESDIKLNIEMKSYSNVVTPISTYIADSDADKREEKLQALLTLVNDGSDEEITAEDLLKVASEASQKAQMVINAIYSEMLDSNSTVLNNTEIISRINEFKNIKVDGLDKKEIAKKYEEYIVNDSDLVSKIDADKLSEDDLYKYTLAIFVDDIVQKDGKSLFILNNYPIKLAKNMLDFSENSLDINIYRLSAASTCSDDFSEYINCKDMDFNENPGLELSETVSIILIESIPNYVEDTSDAPITDIIDKTIYRINTEYYLLNGHASYSTMTIDDFTDGEMSVYPSDKDYYLENSQWVEDMDVNDPINEIYTVVGDKLKIIYTYLNHDDEEYDRTMLISIVEKTSLYWTIKFEFPNEEHSVDEYQKWYFEPTQEMLDPSLIAAPSIETIE